MIPELGQRWRCDIIKSGEPFSWIGEIGMLVKPEGSTAWSKGNMRIIQVITGTMPENRSFIARNQYVTYHTCIFNGREIPEYSVCFFENIDEYDLNGERIFTYLTGQDRPK